MIESISEQAIPLGLNFSSTHTNRQIEEYLNFYDNIQTINRIGLYGSIKLHVASCYGYNEAIQLLLTNNALESLEDISYKLEPYNESRIDEIKKIISKKFQFILFS
jgi:hypothetical protein